jgi:ubiquinone biosynthesis accessory factor UbiJ
MLTEAIENLLNRNLASSPAARELCASLTGRRMAIVVQGLSVRVLVESLGTSLQLKRDPANDPVALPADAEIAGSPVNLMALAGATPEAVIQRGDVRISGDAELAQRFQQLGKLLRPDAEEEMAALFGDSVAHQMARAVKGLFGFGHRAGETTLRNTAEYFAHESRDLVPRAEADVFLNGVDRLREDMDRLEARFAALEASLAPKADNNQ